MWTKEKVDKFIVDYGFNHRETKREIKELPNILYEEEKLCSLLEFFCNFFPLALLTTYRLP